MFSQLARRGVTLHQRRRTLHTTPQRSPSLVGLGTFAGVVLAGLALYLQNSEREIVLAENEKEDSSKTDSQNFSLHESKEDGQVPVYKVVLTGGPCGGKTTALAVVSERLRSVGFRVYNVPEAATLLITGGSIKFSNLTEEEVYQFQLNLIRLMMSLEDSFAAIAKSSGVPSVLISDRGTMDPSAYMHPHSWQVMVDENKWNLVDIRDRRYDCVIHLMTAAIGAEKFYSTENNAARTEGLQEAKELDLKILNAWIGHPNLKIIDNSTDFNTKITRTINAISQVVGAPRPKDSRRKFIIRGVHPDVFAAHPEIRHEVFDLEQTYLTPFRHPDSDEDGFTYVRRRGQSDSYSYSHHTLRHNAKGAEIRLSRNISGRDYLALMKQKDPSRAQVVKRVICFTFDNNYYELETIVKPDIGLSFIVVETDKTGNITFPGFVQVKAEVTDRRSFETYTLASTYSGWNQAKGDWKDNNTLFKEYLESRTASMRGNRVFLTSEE